MLQNVEAGNRAEDLRMDVLQAIRFTIQAWDKINAEIIYNSWCHTKIIFDVNANLRNISKNIRQSENLMLNELDSAFQALNFLFPMRVEEFLNILEEDIVYEVSKDNKIIEELVYLFKNTKTDKENMDLDKMDDSNEMDDSDEIPIIRTSTALASLETGRTFLLQQDNSKEYVKLVRKIEKFLRARKTSSLRQTDINTYFH